MRLFHTLDFFHIRWLFAFAFLFFLSFPPSESLAFSPETNVPNGKIGNTLCLNASAGDAAIYKHIEDVFGRGAVEAPSDDVYSPPRQHITVQRGDKLVGDYFAILAIEPTDVNFNKIAKSKGGDRSRTEIKVAPGSGPQSKFHAKEGDRFTYSWRFKVSPDMRFSKRFTHFHQIMAHGGKLSNFPLITFTARSDGKLSIHYTQHPFKSRPNTIALGSIELAKVAGEWLDVREKILFSNTGSYHLDIYDEKENVVLSIDRPQLDMWRLGATHMRPKWGIYRRHDPALNQNIADYAYFANFSVTKGDEPSSSCR